MWRYGLAIAAITGMLSLLASAQTPAKGKDADKAAARAAQGYAPVTLWDRPDVRAIRVELKPMANRAIHQHDDVKFHLFIPVTGNCRLRSDRTSLWTRRRGRRSISRAALHTGSGISVLRLGRP